MTNIEHLDWNVLSYYYPRSSNDYFAGSEFPELHEGETNWLFINDAITDEMTQGLRERGYSAELVVSGGYVGTYKVWIYKLMK